MTKGTRRCLVANTSRTSFDTLSDSMSFVAVNAGRTFGKDTEQQRQRPLGISVAVGSTKQDFAWQGVYLGRGSADTVARVFLRGDVQDVDVGRVYALDNDGDGNGDDGDDDAQGNNNGNNSTLPLFRSWSKCCARWNVLTAFCQRVRAIRLHYAEGIRKAATGSSQNKSSTGSTGDVDQAIQQHLATLETTSCWALSERLQRALEALMRDTVSIISAATNALSESSNSDPLSGAVDSPSPPVSPRFAWTGTAEYHSPPADFLDALCVVVRGFGVLMVEFPLLRQTQPAQAIVKSVRFTADAVGRAATGIGDDTARPTWQVLVDLATHLDIKPCALNSSTNSKRRVLNRIAVDPCVGRLRDALTSAAAAAFSREFDSLTLAGLAQANWGHCKEYFKAQRCVHLLNFPVVTDWFVYNLGEDLLLGQRHPHALRRLFDCFDCFDCFCFRSASSPAQPVVCGAYYRYSFST